MEPKTKEYNIKRKYLLLYMGDASLMYEEFDFMRELRKRLKKLDMADVKIVFRGIPLQVRREEVLTV